MLDSYRRVLARPGATGFVLSGLVARLPMAMVALGTVLLVESATGSYALAGSVSGTIVLAQALLALAQGRLLDSWGQSRVLPPAVGLFCLTLAGMVASVESGWPVPITYVLAAAAGATMPHIGASSRARWPHVLSDDGEVQTAYALEAVLDEAVFITGPVLITFLAAAVHPVAGLAVAGAAALGGTLVFAAQRSTQPPARRHTSASATVTAMPWRAVLPVALASLAIGALLGAAEVATVAFADEQGRPVAAGWVLAAWALGSLVAGVVTGTVTWHSPPARRLVWGSVAMTLAMAPLPFVTTTLALGIVMLLGGLAIAPTLIAAVATMERVTPAGRLTETMALLETGILGGVAPGAAVAGVVIDGAGASAAYVVSIGAGLVAVLAGLAVQRRSVPSSHLTSSAR